ncbi:hypothetical protein QE386_000268 [Pseudoxanthomonas winnipegensis]|nr:hypothetical protein [Pseudoxanthomonas winnipegensis]MDQ1131673.1 hypothetical protein [Pseudoxanthomonas winnipegensis]
MNQLAHCVLHYARSLWETQQLLPPGDAADTHAAAHARANLHLASLAGSVAALTEAQRVDLARAARCAAGRCTWPVPSKTHPIRYAWR